MAMRLPLVASSAGFLLFGAAASSSLGCEADGPAVSSGFSSLPGRLWVIFGIFVASSCSCADCYLPREAFESWLFLLPLFSCRLWSDGRSAGFLLDI